MMQQGQMALAMMTPDQRKKVVEDALSKASPEERKEMEVQKNLMQQKMKDASPEERLQMAQQAQMMQDMGVFMRFLKPTAEEPNKLLGTVDVLAALAECPSFANLTEAIKKAPADQQKTTIRAFLMIEKTLKEMATTADAAALSESKAKPESRRPLLLLLLVLYKNKLGSAVELDEMTTHYMEATKRLATQLLMHAQMVLPQQRWVHATLAVARVSALLVNELWSHEDPDCVQRMRDILKPPDKPDEPGMPFPELALKARTVMALALESGSAGKLESVPQEPASCLPGQMIAVDLELTRKHACSGEVPSEIADEAANPKGIIEAYWFYLEGHTPSGGAHTLLAAQPLTVTSLETETLPAVTKFEAPKEPGTYSLTVHITSTSVVGCDLTMPLSFVVQDDDVPALE